MSAKPSSDSCWASTITVVEKHKKTTMKETQHRNEQFEKALYVFQGAAIKTANRADKTALPRKRAL